MLLQQVFEERRLRPFDLALGRRPGFAQQAAEQGFGKALDVAPVAWKMPAVIEAGGQILDQKLRTHQPVFLGASRVGRRARKFSDDVLSLNTSG